MSLRSLELTRPAWWRGLRISWPSIGSNRVLYLLLALTLVRGILYAVLNPPFGSPDERDHFQYVQHLATGGAVERGAEGHQPIPYYAMLVPAFWLTASQPADVQLLAIRLASLPFLLGTALFTWLAARKMAPHKPSVWVVATVFVALHPQLAYIGASANNDNAANFVAAVLTCLVVMLCSGGGIGTMLALALTIGASLLTKGQVLPTMVLASLMLIWHAGIYRRVIGHKWVLTCATIAMLLGALALRNQEGGLLIARSQEVLSILANWPALLDTVARVSLEPFSYLFVSFWAAFLGEAVRPAFGWYIAPSLSLILSPVGYAVRIIQSRASWRLLPFGVLRVRALLVAIVLVQWIAVGLRFLQVSHADPGYVWLVQVLQGRFLLVSLVPLALLVAEGWSLLVTRPHHRLALVGMACGSLLLDACSLVTLGAHYSWPTSN